MENKEKKHHHFVPQVYLRKFAHTNENNRGKNLSFVSTYDKIEDKESAKTSIERICAKTKLYTLNSELKEEKERIENFYANTIEKDYNRVYLLITDESKTKITLKERELIIITIINLHLRNYFWFKTFNTAWSSIIRSHDWAVPKNVYTEDGKVLFPFENKSVDEIIEDEKQTTKEVFIKLQLELSVNLLKSHFQDIIAVNTDNSATGFITSDRPVINQNISESFYLPINKHFMLTIMPNKDKAQYDPSTIVRGNPFINARIFNMMQYENAERLIIGNNLSILRQAKVDYDNAPRH